MKKIIQRKNGFTIIETILVIAIGSLIFLALGISIPVLIRNQRDTDRQSDIKRIVSSITQYQASNRKSLPDTSGSNIFYEKVGEQATVSSKWKTFLEQYIKTPFEDPNGNPYKISIAYCDIGVGTGNSCTKTTEEANKSYIASIDGETHTFDWFFGSQNSFIKNDYTILMVIDAKCFGSNDIIAAPGSNTVSVLYRLENSGIYCENN